MTEMTPTLVMIILYLIAVSGFWYMVDRRRQEYPIDLVVGFLTTFLLFVLAYKWYTGWQDYYNGVYLTIQDYLVASFTGLWAIIALLLEVGFLYVYVFTESREVTV